MSGALRRTGRHRHRGAAEPIAAGHGHGHGPAGPSSRRVRLLLAAVLAPVLLATLIGIWLTWPGDVPPSNADVGYGQRPVHGEVLSSAPAPCSTGSVSPAGPSAQQDKCTAVRVRLSDGDSPGVTIQQVLPNEPGTPRFAAGDQLVLAYTGGNPSDPGSYQIQDFQRGSPMLWLVALFVAAVLVLGRWRGLASLLALGFSFLVLGVYLFPALLAGADPVTVGVLAAGVIMFGVLYLTHGVSAQTSSAVLGTLLSLGLIGGLGVVFSAATRLTGLDEDSQNLIRALGHDVDARGLLLAGMIIGALGVLDDVTVTQTSAVWELRRANPALSARALYAAALRIGRDHVSSAVNTLALAYAGAALPVLLTYSATGLSLGTQLTAQNIAQEIVRTLVGSIGLVAAVPLTTAIAAVVARQDNLEPDARE